MLSVEDRVAILDLAARYNTTIDYGDADAWVNTFTPDGVFLGSDGSRVQGAAELRAFADKIHAANEAGGGLIFRHWNSNHVIDGDDDRATHSCYLLWIHCAPEATIPFTGIYHDRLRKVDGEWKFEERRLTAECVRPSQET
jgi:hypothetical protein